MLTIEEIESACDTSQQPDFSRHEIEGPKLLLIWTFYPLGFPAEVRTNSTRVLELFEELWGKFEKRHDTEPILCEVSVVECTSTECPPAPTYRLMLPLLIAVADADNYAVVDVKQSTVRISLSSAALQHGPYVKYFLLGTPGSCISTRYTTPVHAGCVALDGRAVLLCGDSGAGKSSLSYACARAGWTYTSDDGSFLLNGGTHRIVTGDCHQVRLRPTAAELFPELEGMELTPRATGKPSIELPIAPIQHIVRAQTAHVDFMVFLNRRREGPPELVPYRKDVARTSLRQVLYGLPETRAAQHAAIERLLAVEVFELRYRDLNWAVQRLEKLIREER